MDEFFIGEERHSSAGNVYRLVGIPDEQHVLIRRVGVYRADGTLDDGERFPWWANVRMIRVSDCSYLDSART